MILPIFQSGLYLNYTQNSVFATQWTQTSPTIMVNPLNAELNPICHLLALLGVHHILHISGLRVKEIAGIYFVEHTKQYKTYTSNT
jgi:hypothetical protein